MENIEDLCNEVSDLTARIGDICIAYAKLNNHKPNLILHMVGHGLELSSKVGDFEDYDPKISGIIRQLKNEELAEYIADIITENRTNKEIRLPSPLGGYVAMNINDVKDIENALNEYVYIKGEN